MNFSELLFYGGIVGMAITVIVGAVIFFLMVKHKKRLQRKLNEEYGENTHSLFGDN